MSEYRQQLIREGMNREQDLSNQLYVMTKERNRWRSCCIASMVCIACLMLIHFFG